MTKDLPLLITSWKSCIYSPGVACRQQYMLYGTYFSQEYYIRWVFFWTLYWACCLILFCINEMKVTCAVVVLFSKVIEYDRDFSNFARVIAYWLLICHTNNNATWYNTQSEIIRKGYKKVFCLICWKRGKFCLWMESFTDDINHWLYLSY